MNVLVVYKKSQYSFYSVSPEEHVRAFAESDDPDATQWHEDHVVHEASLKHVLATLEERCIRFDMVHRSHMADTSKYDLVIAVGGDGTVLDAGHRVLDTPVLGVNSNPGPSLGHYCACTAENFRETLDNLDTLPRNRFPRLEAVIDGKVVPELALNEAMFAHQNFSATTSYRLNGERHRDSGIVACAAGGSTAFMKFQGGEIMQLDDDRIQYKLHAKAMKTRYTKELHIRSLTREGVVAIDGEHTCYPLSLGQELVLRPGHPITIIGNVRERYGQ